MSRFDIHWSAVDADIASRVAPEGSVLLALWPAPVNADACFAAAGFTDFGDASEDWDRAACALLDHVCARLEGFGEPTLRSKPLMHQPPWYRRFFTAPIPLPLPKQLQAPMHWDSLPDCIVAYGREGASLRTGQGHVMLWITLPAACATTPAQFVASVANRHPVFETPLQWQALLGATPHAHQLMTPRGC